MSPRAVSMAAAAATLFAVPVAEAMPLGKTKLVTKAVTSGPGGDGATYANYVEKLDQAISANGRYVTFASEAQNLQTAVSEDGLSARLFQADLFPGQVQLLDVNAAGTKHAVGP